MKLKDFCVINPRIALKKGEMAKKIAMTDLPTFGKCITNYTVEEYKGGTKFQNGDTIMARITPCLENGKGGYVDLLDEGEIAFGSTEYIVFREKKGVSDSNFIYYFINTPEFRDIAIKSMTGSSGRQRVQLDVISEMEFEFPELEEQRKIAQILCCLDDKIALNSRLNANLEEVCTEIYKECIKKNICSEVLLKDVVSLLGDGLHGTPKYDENGEYYFVNGNNLVNSHILVKEDTKRVNEEEYKKYKKELNDRTILVSINGTIGNVALYNGEKCILGKSACYFNVKEEIGKYFMKYVILSNEFQNSIKYNATGTTIKNVSLKQMREYVLKLPDKNILESVELILADINKKIEINYQMNIHLCSIRDMLLPKIMSGAIELSDINLDI